MTINLFKHNEEAYEKVASLLNKYNKAAVIHPTGSGKSFIAFKLADDNKDKRFLWASPSEYIFRTQVQNLRREYPEVSVDNIEFFTYAKLMVMEESEIQNIKPDYIILDEFHRCGAAGWSTGVERLLKICDKAKVVGLSATHIRYLDGQRNMAKELFNNNIASQITLGEAMVLGILKAPKYVTAIYNYSDELKKYHKWISHLRQQGLKKEAEKYLEMLRRSLERSIGLKEVFNKHITKNDGKYIIFCAGYDHMQEMIMLSKDWFSDIDKSPHVYELFSEDKKSLRQFEDFKQDSSEHLKLLFCIDMLNEGVHVGNIDGVILFRPTVSPIIYKQQIGRALTAAKQDGTVIIDAVNNFENLYSIDSINIEMKQAIEYYRERGESDRIVCDYFEIEDEVQESRFLFGKLEKLLAAPWEHYYKKAVEYYSAHGDLEVPGNYICDDGTCLGNWIGNIRSARKTGSRWYKLTDDQINRLNAIGMRWENKVDYEWNRCYAAAKKFYEYNGHLRVVISYIDEDGIKLGNWIARQRQYRLKGNKVLTEDRIKMLDDIGMIWNPNMESRDYFLEAVKRYYEEYGDINISPNYITEDGIHIGRWLYTQIEKKRHGVLDNELEKKLNEMNLEWRNSKKDKWECGFEHAQKYFDQYGTINIPVKALSDDGYPIGKWLMGQKASYNNGRLDDSRAARLENLGIVWQRRGNWDNRIQEMTDYYNEHGNLDIPADYISPSGSWLGNWVNKIRANKEALSEEEIASLEAIGMQWDTNTDRRWNEMFLEAKQYYEQFGNINSIPSDYKSKNGKNLSAWIREKRRYYKEGKLSDSQIEKLESIGIEWNKKTLWDISYDHAVAYYEKYGNLDPELNYIDESGKRVGRWVYKQRADRKKGRLSKDKIERLDKLKINWFTPSERK